MNNQLKSAFLPILLTSTLVLGLLALCATSVRADVLPPNTHYSAYAVTGPTGWQGGFWWIPAGGSPFTPVLGSCSSFPYTPMRVGSYTHAVSSLTVGEGYGVNLRADTTIGDGATVAYLVSSYVCDPLQSNDILVSLVSTNATIGVYPGKGTASACTALRAPNGVNMWGPICYLTNHPGTLHPEIEFRYVSGVNGRMNADSISFTPVMSGSHRFILTAGWDSRGFVNVTCSDPPSSQTILVQSPDLNAPLENWTPVLTNYSGSGTFVFPPSSAPAVFYRVKSQ